MDRFNITDFPTEILEKIFPHLDDTTITIAASVCKRFNEVLNDTVRRKYNGSSRKKWYKIEVFDWSMENNERHEITQHRPFILKRAAAIELIFHTELNNQNHWIHEVIGRTGRNIRMIRLTTPKIDKRISLNFYNILSKTPNISHLYVDCIYPTNRKWCHQSYRKLTHLEMRMRTMFDENELKSFIKNNGQLKNIELDIIDFRLLYAFDKTKIESLRCGFSHFKAQDIAVHIQPIQMSDLKSIDLAAPKNSLNECIENIVAPCKNLKDLRLVHFDDTTDVLNGETMDILCTFRSMESFEPCFHMSVENVVRLIAKLPKLVSISLWHEKFTIGDYRVLLAEANKHASLRHIRFRERMMDIYDHSLLSWLMANINNQIQVEHSLLTRSYQLVITKGKVRYDGVTIMSSNESPIEYGKMSHDWIQQIEFMASLEDQFYEFFSNLSIPALQALFDEKENTVLHMSGETNEALVNHRGKNITSASTKLSSGYEESVNHINWLEKYCCRLQKLSIHVEHNQLNLPEWSFPELNSLRISGRLHTLDLSIFSSLKCLHLSSLKFVGNQPFLLTNIQVVHGVDLFDNLVILQIFHFNESMDKLLEQFNQNVQRSLQHLTLANRRINGERHKINNKTITAISRNTNLVHLKLILAGIDETNTKYLFENCTKLSELYLECNFLSVGDKSFCSYNSYPLFADIKANCISLERLQLVWHDHMMEPYKVIGIQRTFPNVFIKIMQINDRMNTTAEKIICEKDDQLERLFDEFEV